MSHYERIYELHKAARELDDPSLLMRNELRFEHCYTIDSDNYDGSDLIYYATVWIDNLLVYTSHYTPVIPAGPWDDLIPATLTQLENEYRDRLVNQKLVKENEEIARREAEEKARLAPYEAAAAKLKALGLA